MTVLPKVNVLFRLAFAVCVDRPAFLPCSSPRSFSTSIQCNLQHVDLLGAFEFPPTSLQQIVPGSIRPANWMGVSTRLPPRHRSLDAAR
jgi:hypothetical protein